MDKHYDVDYGVSDEAANNDCNRLHVLVMHNDENVMLEFCSPLSYLIMPPELMITLAESMIEKAKDCLAQQKEKTSTH